MSTGKATSLFDAGSMFTNAVDAVTGIGDRAEGVNNHDGRQIAIVFGALGIGGGAWMQRRALAKEGVTLAVLSKATMLGGAFPKLSF